MGKTAFFTNIHTSLLRPLGSPAKAAPLFLTTSLPSFPPFSSLGVTNPSTRDSDTSLIECIPVFDCELTNNCPCTRLASFPYCWCRVLLCHGPGVWSGALHGFLDTYIGTGRADGRANASTLTDNHRERDGFMHRWCSCFGGYIACFKDCPAREEKGHHNQLSIREIKEKRFIL